MNLRPFAAHVLVAATAVAAVAAWGGAAAGAESELRVYAGRIEPSDDAETGSAKDFRLLVYLTGDAQRSEALWLIEDDSRDQTWLERFGHQTVAAGRLAVAESPRIGVRWPNALSRVPVIALALWPEQPPTPGSQWDQDGLRYEVVGESQTANVASWEISGRNNFGEKRVFWSDRDRPWLTALQETVFIGEGQRHRLRLELAAREPLDAAAWQRLSGEFQALEDLRTKTGWNHAEPGAPWTAEQTMAMRDALPPLADRMQTAGVQRLVQTAIRDVSAESARTETLDAVRRRALAKKLPEFQLQGVRGKPLTRPDLQGVVTVIHFWDYRESPLREPYGQSGYLDFLFRRYEPQGVRVVGVVTNQQSEDEATQRDAILSARKFASFMNLAYPLYLDRGELLKSIGDPRSFETSLPLFVVVARNGQIVHYSPGNYRVEGNQGLVELENAIRAVLETAE